MGSPVGMEGLVRGAPCHAEELNSKGNREPYKSLKRGAVHAKLGVLNDPGPKDQGGAHCEGAGEKGMQKVAMAHTGNNRFQKQGQS